MDYYRIACIVRSHGVHGAVKLLPLTDDAARFENLREAYLEVDGKRRPVTFHAQSVQPEKVIVTIEGIQTREQAEALRGAYICVDKAHAVALPPGRYFIADLIGCAVADTAGVAYGHITDVLETGANDVYVIEGEKPLLLPALKKVLVDVDTENKRVLLDADVVKEVAVFAD